MNAQIQMILETSLDTEGRKRTAEDIFECILNGRCLLKINHDIVDYDGKFL